MIHDLCEPATSLQTFASLLALQTLGFLSLSFMRPSPETVFTGALHSPMKVVKTKETH